MKAFIFALATATAAWSVPSDAQRQNPYAVTIRVNDSVITNFEVTQRILLLRAFGTSGDLEKTAREQLVEDRLRIQAAAQAGLIVTAEELEGGVSEFAARSELTADQLYQYVDKNGATKESMKEFVRAGLLWRNLVQARFAGQAKMSNNEIDETLNLSTVRKQQSILFSEIRLPLNQFSNEKVFELAEQLSNSITTENAFAEAAQQHSQSPSRSNFGRLDWLPVAQLPAALAAQIMALEPGEVTAPITSGQTLSLFQLRGVRDEQVEGSGPVTLKYVLVNIPGEPSSKHSLADATKLINDVDTCNDLRAASRRFEPSGYTSNLVDVDNVPPVIAIELANLDRHEASYYTNSKGTLTVVMLCDRLRKSSEDVRKKIRINRFNQRMSGYGQSFLDELKADAVIEYQ